MSRNIGCTPRLNQFVSERDVSPGVSKSLCIKTTGKQTHINKSQNAGLQIFRGKKGKISRDFPGQIAEKSADFAGFSREKSQNSRNNRPISVDFRRRKVKIRRKIGPFCRILAEKSQFSKDFQGQILRKIGRFHGKFRGETSPRNNQ